MDSFKTLFEKKQYDLIIKLTKTSDKPDDFLYCASAYVAKGMFLEALCLLDEKKDILEKSRLPLYMKMYIDILCLSGKFNDAYNKVKYFENLPYYSQEAEEVLRSLNDYIKESEINSLKHSSSKDEDDLLNDLHSKDSITVIDALNQIRERKIDPYLLSIVKILTSFPKQSVRSIALLVLVEAKYDKEVNFLHVDKVISVIPSTLKSPFDDDFVKLNDLVSKRYKDPSLINVILKILTTYLVYYYPNPIPENDSFFAAICSVGCSMLNINPDLSLYESDEKLLNDYISLIKIALEEE